MIGYAMQVNWAGSPGNPPNWGPIGIWGGFGESITELHIDEGGASGKVTFTGDLGGPYVASLTWNAQEQNYTVSLVTSADTLTETWNFNNGKVFGANLKSDDSGNTVTGSVRISGNEGHLMAKGSIAT